jgi:hypothetical protein
MKTKINLVFFLLIASATSIQCFGKKAVNPNIILIFCDDLDSDQNNQWVLFSKAQKGINPEETILPEGLKEAGYSTAIIDKWHIGYLQAVRYGDWKLNLLGAFSEKKLQNILNSTYKHIVFPGHAELYNLRSDPGETTDVAEKFPEMVAQIRKIAEKEKTAPGEYTTKGPEVRKTIFIDFPELLMNMHVGGKEILNFKNEGSELQNKKP